MLSGDEDLLRLRAIQECVKTATIEDDFDIEFAEAGVTTPSEWSATVGTTPFLSSRRCVVVRHLLRCDQIDTTGWDSLPDTAFLVLVADDETGDDSRQRSYGTVKANWEKAVGKIGGYVESFKTNPKQLVESIREEATRLGKKMSPRAAETLAEMCGFSLSRSLEELEKVTIFAGKAEQITEGDVKSAAMPSRDWNVFRMVDSAITGDGGEALRQLRILVGTATKAEEAAFGRILPTVHRQLKLIWQARAIIEAGLNAESLPDEFASRMPQNPDWMKQAPFVRKKAMQMARNTTFERLTACFELLSDTDAQVKGMLPSYNAMESLEQMLLKMIAVLRPSVAA